MFCKNCGKELKEGIGFCPECGTKITKDKTQKNKKAGIKIPEKSSLTASLSAEKELPKLEGLNKKILLAAGAILVVILLIVSMLHPKASDIDTEMLVGNYLLEHTEYSSNQNQYEKCYEHVMLDMTKQIREVLTPISEQLGFSSYQSERIFKAIGDLLSKYFSNKQNQTAIVGGILSYSDYEVGKAKKVGDVISADVTISFKNITKINECVIGDISSGQGFTAFVAQLAISGTAGIIENIATRDISFLVDSFLEQASVVQNDSYIGQVEFVYNKDTKEWEISHFDTRLLDVYYGIK